MKTNLRIQSRFMILMGLLTVALFVSVIILWRSQKKLENDFLQSSVTERIFQLDKTVDINGKNLETLANDYSWWDEMISFVRRPDTNWAVDNIITGLKTFQSDAAWVFDTRGSLVYSCAGTDNNTLIKDNDIVNTIHSGLTKSPFNHFFIQSSEGIVEVRSAPLQPTSDQARLSSPQGYFVAAKIWDDNYLNALAGAINAEILFEQDPSDTLNSSSAGENLSLGKFIFYYPLKGVDGETVTELSCAFTSPLYVEIDSFHTRLILFLLAFAGLNLLSLTQALRRWVNQPLRSIMGMLQSQSADPINERNDSAPDLDLKGEEFSRIGLLVRDFFDQKARLERNMVEQRKAESALRSSENLLRLEKRKTELILDSAAEGICGIDLKGRVTFINKAGASMLGWDPKRLLGESLNRFASYVNPNSDPPSTTQLKVKAPLRDGEVHVAADELFWRQNGTGFPVEYNSAPIHDDGKPAGAVLIFRDISERIKTEEQLNKLWHAMEQSPVSISIMDSRGKVEYVNPKYLESTEQTKDQVVGKDIRLLTSEKYSAEYYYEMWKTLIDGGIWRNEHHGFTKNGKAQWESIFISPVRSPHGQVTHYLAIREDITDRKEAEEGFRLARDAAEAANRAKSAFLANMSHEIRTPMNAILGYTQLLARNPELDSEARQYVKIINRSGEHLLALINNILEMSKIEAGRVVINAIPFNLVATLDDLAAMFKIRAESKKLLFSVNLAADIPSWIDADEGKVRQILVNLLGNAIKFTQNGTVTLKASAKQHGKDKVNLAFDVIDTGPGIAKNELNMLFHQFEQTESGRNAESGTGLGLAISRQYARLMGGDISVTSELGKGSVFHIEIPVGVVDSQAMIKKDDTRRIIGLKMDKEAIRVLIVDDRESNREWLSRILTSIGFLVREVSDGKQAVDIWNEWKPNLILMDIRLPIMNGHEAARKIRASSDGKNVKIIALTASAFEKGDEAAQQSGMDDFLLKPFKVDELLEKLKTHLGLNYIYETEQPHDNQQEAELPLSSDALSKLSATLLTEIEETTLNGDIDHLKKLLDGMASEDRKLANSLLAMADRYDYEQILKLLNGVKELSLR